MMSSRRVFRDVACGTRAACARAAAHASRAANRAASRAASSNGTGGGSRRRGRGGAVASACDEEGDACGRRRRGGMRGRARVHEVGGAMVGRDGECIVEAVGEGAMEHVAPDLCLCRPCNMCCLYPYVAVILTHLTSGRLTRSLTCLCVGCMSLLRKLQGSGPEPCSIRRGFAFTFVEFSMLFWWHS